MLSKSQSFPIVTAYAFRIDGKILHAEAYKSPNSSWEFNLIKESKFQTYFVVGSSRRATKNCHNCNDPLLWLTVWLVEMLLLAAYKLSNLKSVSVDETAVEESTLLPGLREYVEDIAEL